MEKLKLVCDLNAGRTCKYSANTIWRVARYHIFNKVLQFEEKKKWVQYGRNMCFVIFFYIFFSAWLFTEELMEDGMSSYLPDGQSVMNPASSFHAIHSTCILCSAYYAPKIHIT